MVDGVSANIGVGVSAGGAPGSAGGAGNGLGGTLGSFSVLGGTNSLVSVDAMQEFRIQTSTFAPEFGRTPGGQISIVTRSGTNEFHGSAFDYLRNDILDANDWFADNEGLPKPEERQNDFGGTFSGPIIKDRTFFFFSYEGLRLRLPQVTLTTVPDVLARQNALPAMQPFLKAFPLPNGPDQQSTGSAQFNASYSNAASLDACSLRVDHKVSDKINLFVRYNYSPSELDIRGNGSPLSTLTTSHITIQTGTLGATWLISPTVANDLRFNYSRTSASSQATMDTFGGAAPLSSLPFPSGFNSQNGLFALTMASLQGSSLRVGEFGQNLQRQINVVDSLSVQKGSHNLKFGVDFRRLSPLFSPEAYEESAYFGTVSSAESGTPVLTGQYSNLAATFSFRNLGVYVQDTWRIVPRFTLTYGLRWDVDFVPEAINGPNFPAVTGFNLNNLSNLALAPTGTRPYKTTYGNFAPRVGAAYQLFRSQKWQTVLRGGFGVFYDLASSEMGNNLVLSTYPFGSFAVTFEPLAAFPIDPTMLTAPPITPANVASGTLLAINPNLALPYTLEWNVALEQALGNRQTISTSYVGAAGRRLLQTANVTAPNQNLAEAQLLTNAGTSDYDALQVQFQRQLSRGLQAVASYSWSHSIDTGSAGSTAIASNALLRSVAANRGPSDFDIRNSFSAALTYDVPTPKINRFTSVILGGWSSENVIQARSAPPVDVNGNIINGVFVGESLAGFYTFPRPDVVPGQPFYLYGSAYPGGKAFNAGAFTAPPLDPITGALLRNGDLPRNALRGFGATQWDFAVHRNFPIRESLKLQFRAEMFNVLNHPNFGPPDGLLSDPTFGKATQMLGQSLGGGNVGSGDFSPLYQIGGPRSIQLALKAVF